MVYVISTNEVSKSKLLSWHTVSLVSDSEIVCILKMKVKSDHCSKFSNFTNWKEEAWKTSGLQQDSNPWPPRYRCDARPTELWSHTLGARPFLLGSYLPMQWNDVKYVMYLQPQYKYGFHIYFTAFHCMGRYNSTNWPGSQCVASQLSWSSIASISQSSRVRIPLKPWYFSGFFLPIA